MASRNALVADAVATALNASSPLIGEAFTARRVYIPGNDLATLRDMQVTVICVDNPREAITRGKTQLDINVQIGIQKRLAVEVDPTLTSANALLDPLMEFCEAVADLFRPGQGELGATGAAVLRVEHAPIIDPEHLLQHRVFTNVVTVILRTIY